MKIENKIKNLLNALTLLIIDQEDTVVVSLQWDSVTTNLKSLDICCMLKDRYDIAGYNQQGEVDFTDTYTEQELMEILKYYTQIEPESLMLKVQNFNQIDEM